MKKFGKLSLHSSKEIIAVGDIHGELGKLQKLMLKVLPFLENSDCHLVFCGDYFDRGYNSPGVFEYLTGLKKRFPKQVFFLLGNHEIMLWQTLVEKKTHWLRWTKSTLNQMVSYWDITKEATSDFDIVSTWDWENVSDLKIIESVCKEKGVLDFLSSLIPYYESNLVICTHAPLDKYSVAEYFKYPRLTPLLDTQNVCWTFVEEPTEGDEIPKLNKYLICGHQAIMEASHPSYLKPRIYDSRAFIDTGCGLSNKRPLTAFRFPSKEYYQEA